ncbi:MAG: helix-turn-helix domain-containing protein, partial [bacterium]
VETAKLTRSDVLEIVRRYDAGETQMSIARDFPVSQSAVSKIVRGENWGHVTGIESE